jgi:hypothetical protein
MPTRLPYGVSFIKPNVAANSGNFMFVAGDVTPDVGLGTFFLANATSAVTITNFDGGEIGKIIYVLSTTASITTIQDSAGGIITSRMVIAPYASGSGVVVTTAGNLVLQVNELVGFIKGWGGSWYQIDKSVQL